MKTKEFKRSGTVTSIGFAIFILALLIRAAGVAAIAFSSVQRQLDFRAGILTDAGHSSQETRTMTCVQPDTRSYQNLAIDLRNGVQDSASK